jgi:hypothetical protein
MHGRFVSLLAGLTLAAAPTAALPADPAASPLARLATLIFGGPRTVESVRVVYFTTLHSAADAGEIEQRISYVFPDTVRQEVDTPMGEQSIVLDAEGGFLEAGERRMPLDAEAVAQARRQLARDLITLAAHVGDPQLASTSAGSETIDDRPCERVEIAYLGATSRLWIDADGRVLRQTFQGRHPLSGETGEFTVRYEDYVENGGLVLPRRQVLSFGGQELVTIRLARVELDPPSGDPPPPPAAP